jgi:hypothetical protein
MAYVDDATISKLDQVTIDAVVRAAGRGLLTTTEAGLLINRIHTRPARSLSSTPDSPAPEDGRRTGSRPSVDPDRTVS